MDHAEIVAQYIQAQAQAERKGLTVATNRTTFVVRNKRHEPLQIVDDVTVLRKFIEQYTRPRKG